MRRGRRNNEGNESGASEDQHLLMGRAGRRAGDYVGYEMGSTGPDCVLSTDMQSGTTVVQLHGCALHERKEEGVAARKPRRSRNGVGARCRESASVASGLGYHGSGSQTGVPLAVIEQDARP